MTDQRSIKAIFFDLGNVIVRVDPVMLEGGYAAYGRIREGQIIDYFMDSDNMNRYMEGKLTSSQFYSRTRRLFKLDIRFHEFYRIWNSIFAPYPEVEEIIRTIRRDYPEIKMILVSNTNESHYEFLRDTYNILDVLDGCVVSHEGGEQKPHPAIFNEALALAGSIPRNTFYTDDRPELISAARVMGIRAFQFVGHEQLRDQLAQFGIRV